MLVPYDPQWPSLFEEAAADLRAAGNAAWEIEHDRRRYNDGKTLVIQQIMDRARAARGLASVIVFEK